MKTYASHNRPVNLSSVFSKLVGKMIINEMNYLRETNYFNSVQFTFNHSYDAVMGLLNITGDMWMLT